ncbi:hypothetical protein CVT24_011840 [Panaeolus cyanescens]|uniref:Uncharacterized protein n=1 Tax=Panaeolus cyanescens TaxID=181874 RepID=A0A409YNU9_9AGAR|nr:hypothetical protein CVT24_011840 [Panaeolus cyanescens]
MPCFPSTKKPAKEERKGLVRVPQLSRRPKSWIIFLMGRYTDYYGEDDKLPEGMVCTGYDADTGRRYYRDMTDGSVWVGAPYAEYGVLNSVLNTSKTSPKEDNLRFQRKIFSEESEDEKEATRRNQRPRLPTKSNSVPAGTRTRDSRERINTGVSSETATLVAPDIPPSSLQDEEMRLIAVLESTANLNLPKSPNQSTTSKRKRKDKRANSEPLSPISVATSPSTYSQSSQWSKSSYEPNTLEIQLRNTENASSEPDRTQTTGSRAGEVQTSLGEVSNDPSPLSPISMATTPSMYSQQSTTNTSEKRTGRSQTDLSSRNNDQVESPFDDDTASPGSTPTILARRGEPPSEANSELARKKSSETQYRSSFGTTPILPTNSLFSEREPQSLIPFPSSANSSQEYITPYPRPVSSLSATTISTVTATPVTARTSFSMSSTITMFASPHSETSPLLLQSERSPGGPSGLPLIPHTPPGLGPLSPRSISIYPETPSALGHDLTIEDFKAHERLFESPSAGKSMLNNTKPVAESPLRIMQTPAALNVTGLDGLPSPPGPTPGTMSMNIFLPSEQLRAISSQRQVEIESGTVTTVHQTPEYHLDSLHIPNIVVDGGGERDPSKPVTDPGASGKVESAANNFPGFSLKFESVPELNLGFEVANGGLPEVTSNVRTGAVVELPSRPKPTQPPSLSRRESMSLDAANHVGVDRVKIEPTSGNVESGERIKIDTRQEKKVEVPKRKSMFRRVSDLLGKGK